ncbi:MAG: hypothetical protein KGS44_03830, partial [Alphaproteobacteria bacterium]|nr:hypothetical protein [Alphaproteobacteria bacterium]
MTVHLAPAPQSLKLRIRDMEQGLDAMTMRLKSLRATLMLILALAPLLAAGCASGGGGGGGGDGGPIVSPP